MTPSPAASAEGGTGVSTCSLDDELVGAEHEGLTNKLLRAGSGLRVPDVEVCSGRGARLRVVSDPEDPLLKLPHRLQKCYLILSD